MRRVFNPGKVYGELTPLEVTYRQMSDNCARGSSQNWRLFQCTCNHLIFRPQADVMAQNGKAKCPNCYDSSKKERAKRNHDKHMTAWQKGRIVVIDDDGKKVTYNQFFKKHQIEERYRTYGIEDYQQPSLTIPAITDKVGSLTSTGITAMIRKVTYTLFRCDCGHHIFRIYSGVKYSNIKQECPHCSYNPRSSQSIRSHNYLMDRWVDGRIKVDPDISYQQWKHSLSDSDRSKLEDLITKPQKKAPEPDESEQSESELSGIDKVGFAIIEYIESKLQPIINEMVKVVVEEELKKYEVIEDDGIDDDDLDL